MLDSAKKRRPDNKGNVGLLVASLSLFFLGSLVIACCHCGLTKMMGGGGGGGGVVVWLYHCTCVDEQCLQNHYQNELVPVESSSSVFHFNMEGFLHTFNHFLCLHICILIAAIVLRSFKMSIDVFRTLLSFAFAGK